MRRRSACCVNRFYQASKESCEKKRLENRLSTTGVFKIEKEAKTHFGCFQTNVDLQTCGQLTEDGGCVPARSSLNLRLVSVSVSVSVSVLAQQQSPLKRACEGEADDASSKRKKPEDDPCYKYESITEYIDVNAIKDCLRQIDELRKTNLSAQEHKRADMFVRWLHTVQREAGAVMSNGPLGFTVRPLECRYRNRYGGGRLYATGMEVIENGDGKRRTVCIQGAPRELRPFLCGRFGCDIDIANCQPEILRQFLTRLTWADKRKPPDMQQENWCLIAKSIRPCRWRSASGDAERLKTTGRTRSRN